MQAIWGGGVILFVENDASGGRGGILVVESGALFGGLVTEVRGEFESLAAGCTSSGAEALAVAELTLPSNSFFVSAPQEEACRHFAGSTSTVDG